MKSFKLCFHCKKSYPRHSEMNDYTWNISRFCSPKCRNAVINERHKANKTGQARVRRARDKSWQPTVPADHPLLTVRFDRG